MHVEQGFPGCCELFHNLALLLAFLRVGEGGGAWEQREVDGYVLVQKKKASAPFLLQHLGGRRHFASYFWKREASRGRSGEELPGHSGGISLQC